MKVFDLEEKFYYEDEKKSFKPKKIVVESVKLINDDRQKPIYQTTSFNDILNSLDRVEGIRVSYLPFNKTFLYADVSQWIHPMMLIQALNQGLFPNISNYTQLTNSQLVYNFGITNKEDGVREFENDSYTTRRDYGNFTIMTRPDQDIFEKTDIQDILSRY